MYIYKYAKIIKVYDMQFNCRGRRISNQTATYANSLNFFHETNDILLIKGDFY